MIGLVLVVVAVAAIFIGRSDFGQSAGGSSLWGGPMSTTTVTAVVGSEKRPFFEDERVIEALGDLGYRVEIDTAGSREIATDVNLADYDFAFPSSTPAADKIAAENENLGLSTPFHSPMAIATFDAILEILEQEGVARNQGGTWFIDMDAYVELAASGSRWRDLSESYPSPRSVQISSTDIRTSNSAAMYLSILSWVLNDARVPTDADIDPLVQEARPLFVGQGYTDSSSAGPFADYLSQGIGAKPMVMVYEAQYLGELMSPDSRISEDMTLAYPDPTVLSNHTTVALTDNGAEVARLLAEDEQLQRLAAEYGFRPADPAIFEAVLTEKSVEQPPHLLTTVDLPAYEHLEALIDGVGAQYTSPAPPADHEEHS